MFSYFNSLLDTGDFPARWHCGNWSAFEGWFYIVADLLIFVAYAAIPSALFLIMRRRRDVPFPVIGWLFIAFILFCGLTHLLDAIMFWWPAYRLGGLIKACTAAVSLTTAFVLARALPELINLPGLKTANEKLSQALDRESHLRQELSKVRDALELRSSQLTLRDRRMRNSLNAAVACAVCWEQENGSVLWEIGVAEVLKQAGLPLSTAFESWADLIGEDEAERLRAVSADACERGDSFHLRLNLAGTSDYAIRMTATPEDAVKGQPRTMAGMIGLVPSDS